MTIKEKFTAGQEVYALIGDKCSKCLYREYYDEDECGVELYGNYVILPKGCVFSSKEAARDWLLNGIPDPTPEKVTAKSDINAGDKVWIVSDENVLRLKVTAVRYEHGCFRYCLQEGKNKYAHRKWREEVYLTKEEAVDSMFEQ